MSWMAHSETPFISAQRSVIDVSGLADQFRDGQKLRQEYETRQQQKALNEISREGDFNTRLSKAREHKYAGALVPLIQKQEQDRLTAEQTYNQGQADINKTNAEVGKIGAEQGEIGVKTTGQTIKNMTDKYSQISAGALTQNPQYFALMLGDFQNAGLINPEQKGAVIDMMMKDPENAAKVMQQLARGTIEGFKATAPEAKVLDGKDAAYMYSVNPYTGEANEPTQRVAYGQSPDNILDNETSRLNNQNTVAGSMYNSDNTYNASVYGTDVRSEDTRYNTDVTSQDRQLKLDQDGKIGWAKVSQAQQKLDNPQANRKPVPPSAMKIMGELKQDLQSNAITMTENGKWMNRLRGGELELGAVKNFNNTAAARTGVTSLGSNPKAYAEFKAYITDLANKALRLNAGVQTDADYKRQLDAIVAGSGLPRNNDIALGLLNRIHRDFDSQNRGIYKNLSAYEQEYRGVTKRPYNQTDRSPKKTTAKTSAGQAIGKKVFGGG